MANEPRNYVANWADGSPRGAIPLQVAQTSTGVGTAFVLPKAMSAFGLEYFRGTTSATLESTSAAIVVQARLGSTNWFTLGSGSITVNSATPVAVRSTNSIPFTQVRCNITSFTTSAGAATTSERRIPITVYLTAGVGSS